MSIRQYILLALLALSGVAALAGDDDNFQRGYRQGYDDGFKAGLRAAQIAPAAAATATQAFPSGPPRIRVLSALYGSDRKQCDAMRYVHPRASGRSSATIPVTNDMCGDPDFGERKSLRVSYGCNGVEKNTSAFEHRDLYLTCP